MTASRDSSLGAFRYDEVGKCLECGGLGGCHSLACAEKKAQSSLGAGRILSKCEGGWMLVERYVENYPDDWRLVFKQGGEVLEVSVPQEVWRAFDAPNPAAAPPVVDSDDIDGYDEGLPE